MNIYVYIKYIFPVKKLILFIILGWQHWLKINESVTTSIIKICTTEGKQFFPGSDVDVVLRKMLSA